MKRKILWIFNHYAQTPNGAGGTRHFGLAVNLNTLGWNTYIMAASVDHSDNTQRVNGFSMYKEEKINDVNFIWIKTNRYKGNGLSRWINMLAYSFMVLFLGLKRNIPRPDIVVGSSVHPFAAVSAFLISKLFKVPFIFEVRDLWPQTLIDFGRLKEDSLTCRILKKVEIFLYKNASKIIVVMPNAYSYIVPLGINPEKIYWLPNGVDEYELSDLADCEKNVFRLMYFGAHGEANNLVEIIDAMRILPKVIDGVAVELELIGDGACKNDLMLKCINEGLTNIYFKNSIPKSEIPLVARRADAFIISVLNRPNLYKYGISMNKLYDYMMAAKPVIIAACAYNNPIEESKSGICVDSGNPVAISEAIKNIIKLSAEDRFNMGMAGRKYAISNYSFAKLALKFNEELLSVINEKIH